MVYSFVLIRLVFLLAKVKFKFHSSTDCRVCYITVAQRNSEMYRIKFEQNSLQIVL